jgi:hypothetical protein
MLDLGAFLSFINGTIDRLLHSRTRLSKPPVGLCSFAPEHHHDCYITFPGPLERKKKKPHATSLRTKKPHAALRNLSNMCEHSSDIFHVAIRLCNPQWFAQTQNILTLLPTPP